MYTRDSLIFCSFNIQNIYYNNNRIGRIRERENAFILTIGEAPHIASTVSYIYIYMHSQYIGLESIRPNAAKAVKSNDNFTPKCYSLGSFFD